MKAGGKEVLVKIAKLLGKAGLGLKYLNRDLPNIKWAMYDSTLTPFFIKTFQG